MTASNRFLSLLLWLTVCISMQAQTLVGYEYWIDDDYAGHSYVPASQSDIFMMVDVCELTTGVHFYNFRVSDTNGSISAPYRYLFYIPESATAAASLATCEYWLDDDYANKTTAQASESNVFAVDVSDLSTGVHFYNYRVADTNGGWSAPYRYLFYVPETFVLSKNLIGYEYWMDDDYEHKTYVASSDENQSIIIDINELATGVHFFNHRAFDDNGGIGSPSRFLFYIPEHGATGDNRICGYSYSFNNVETFVPLTPCNEYEMDAAAIPLPDPIDIAAISTGSKFAFGEDSVELCQNILVNFLLRFKNVDGEWSMPICHEYEDEYTVSKPYVELPLQKSILFDKVRLGDFNVAKFTLPKTGTYYLRSTQACEMYLFDDNGKRLASINAASLTNTYAASLAGGTYYGVIFNTITDAANSDEKVGLRLMSTNNYVPTPEIRYEDETVTIFCEQEDATIHYTLDGSTPDENSTKYTKPFSLKRNAIIKAIARAADYADSFVATYTVDSYKVETPTIQFANLHIYIECGTEESAIYYTLDGSDPVTNGKLYTSPISMTSNCTVKAVAKREGYKDSDVETYVLDVSSVKCGKPTLSVSGNLLTMSTITEGATIHYTSDGTTPSSKSSVYKSPILLDHNATYRAVAVKSGEIDSEMSEITIDWFQAEMPEFAFADGMLTISCSTPGSSIHYEIGGDEPTRGSAVYKSPISLSDNKVVKAFAVADGFNDSEIVSYYPMSFACETPTIEYDGRAITLASGTEGAAIYYTIDGSNPKAEEENRFTSKTILPGLCTVKAIAVKEDMNNSTMLTFTVPSYYNGGTVYVQAAGTMHQAFNWCGGSPSGDTMKIEGNMSDDDFATLRSFKEVRHLNLDGVNVGSVPEKAFEGMNILEVEMPTSRYNSGGKLFSGCRSLAAVTWNSTTVIPQDVFDGMNLPNILLYVKSASVASASFHNVIVNGTAEEITLADSETSNFYCPRSFTAKKISYSHEYSQRTGIDRCMGWESIALPFAPTSITHPLRGEMTPFAANDSRKKPFWLCELTSSGFVSAPSIEANTPYIIAMPNNDKYSDEYILAGTVTFSGKNVRVESSDEMVYGNRGDFLFVPNFQITPKAECMALNVGEEYNGHSVGSLFAQGLRDALPFEAYVTISSMQLAPRQVFYIDGETSGLETLETDAEITVTTEGDDVFICGTMAGDNITLTSLDGVTLINVIAEGAETTLTLPRTDTLILNVTRMGRTVKQTKFIN